MLVGTKNGYDDAVRQKNLVMHTKASSRGFVTRRYLVQSTPITMPKNNINEKAMDLHNNSVVYYLGKQVKTDLFPYFVITTLCVKTYQERRAKSFDEN